MNYAARYLAYNIPSLLCLAGAVGLLIAKVEHGWGWLLLFGFLFHAYVHDGDGEQSFNSGVKVRLRSKEGDSPDA